TTSVELAGDPDFEALPDVTLAELFERPVRAPGPAFVIGPGAALSTHDTLWYLDVPKRYAEAATADGRGHNLGRPGVPPTTRRLFYVDWPLLDRHRGAIAGGVELWIDAQDPARPLALDAATLRATAAELATTPLRTRPTFNTTPWGGQWGRRRLGMGGDRPNTALGYELIAPESGVLVGDAPHTAVEIPFELLV